MTKTLILDSCCDHIDDLCGPVVPSEYALFYTLVHEAGMWLLLCFLSCQNSMTYISNRFVFTCCGSFGLHYAMGGGWELGNRIRGDRYRGMLCDLK